MIQNLLLKSFFKKYYFGHTTFLYLSTNCRKYYGQQKLVKKTTHFTIQFHSTRLTLKIICSQNIAKNLPNFTNCPANMFLFGVKKNVCTAPFLDT